MIVNWKPKKFKFKRLHKGIIKKCRYKYSARKTQEGVFGLKALKSVRLTAKQLEQVRRKILTIRKKKEKQRIWLRCLPDTSITSKAIGIRMGKGKGAVNHWVSKLVAGKVIFHLNHMSITRAKIALRKAKKILPIPTKMYINKDYRPNNKNFSIISY